MVERRFNVRLSCGCTRLFSVAPMKGDVIWCTKHNDEAVIIVPRIRWKLRCYQCPHTVNTGGPQEYINARASIHVFETGHRVHVWEEDGQASYIVSLQTNG